MCVIERKGSRWSENTTQKDPLTSKEFSIKEVLHAAIHTEGVRAGTHDRVSGEHTQTITYHTTAILMDNTVSGYTMLYKLVGS